MSGIPYHASTHLPKSQGGTDPIEMPGGNDWFYAIWSQSTVSYAANTWGEIASVDAFGQEYFEYFISDPNEPGFAFDEATGILSWDPDYLIFVTGQTLWSDSFSVGDTVGVGLNFGVSGSFTGDRQINITYIDHVSSQSGEWNTVNAHSWPSFNLVDSVRVEALHTAGSAKNLGDVRLTAHSIRKRLPGTFTNP